MQKEKQDHKEKQIHATGTRKKAVAHAVLAKGRGVVRINSLRLDRFGTLVGRERILEPLRLAGESAGAVNIDVSVRGGGAQGQADAVRTAISRALVQHEASLEKTFLEYDRQLLVADVRQKESVKPGRHGQARAKRQKSYR